MGENERIEGGYKHTDQFYLIPAEVHAANVARADKSNISSQQRENNSIPVSQQEENNSAPVSQQEDNSRVFDSESHHNTNTSHLPKVGKFASKSAYFWVLPTVSLCVSNR